MTSQFRRLVFRASAIRCAAVIALAATCVLAASPLRAVEPAVIFSVKSFGELEKDVAYLGQTVQQPLLGVMFSGLIAQFTGGQGLAGMDVTKPLGGFLTLTPEGQPGDGVVIVPVSDAKAFTATLKTMFPNPKQVNGLTQYEQPGGGQSFFAKEGPKHFLFSTGAEMLAEKIDPDKILSSAADISVELDLTKIAAPLKEFFLSQLEAQAAAAAESRADDSEARRRGEELGRKTTLKAFQTIVREGNRLSLALNVDSKAKSVSLALGVVARPKSSLADACVAYAKLESPYSGLVNSNTVGSLFISAPVHPDARAMFELAIDEGERSAAEAAKSDPAKKEAAEFAKRMTAAFRQSLKLDRWDQGFLVNTAGAGKVQMIAAQKLNAGNNLSAVIEEAVRKDPEAAGRVKLNVSQIGKAKVHSLTLPDDSDIQKHFGSAPANIAIADDAVWLVLGGDPLTDLKSAMEAKPVKTTRPPISLRIRLAKVWALVQAANPASLELGKSAFKGDDDGIALEVVGRPEGLTLHFEIQEGVLRLIALSAAQARPLE